MVAVVYQNCVIVVDLYNPDDYAIFTQCRIHSNIEYLQRQSSMGVNFVNGTVTFLGMIS